MLFCFKIMRKCVDHEKLTAFMKNTEIINKNYIELAIMFLSI